MSLLGLRLSECLLPGTAVLLSGPIGAGKTHLARAIIQARLPVSEDVPSPTYTIVQTYVVGETEIWHADLYRLSDSSELTELGLEDAFETGITLVEWPDRLPRELLPEKSVSIEIEPVGEKRRVTISTTDKSIHDLLARYSNE